MAATRTNSPLWRCRGPALASVVFAGCFHDDPPRQLGCDPGIERCGASAASTSTTGAEPGTTSGATSSTGAATTGAPSDRSVTFRIDSLEIVDPHLFLESNGCVDATAAINQQGIASQIEMAELNLLLHFEDFTQLTPQLKEAESCDVAADTCVDKAAVSLQVPAKLDTVGPCSTLASEVLQLANLGDLNELAPPCYRTDAANISLPIQDAAVPLKMREAQFVFNIDDPEAPQALQNGLLYGFITKDSAEATELSVLGTKLVIWPMVAPSAACEMMYPDQLPSADEILDGDVTVAGAWLVVNFTARRVELLPAP